MNSSTDKPKTRKPLVAVVGACCAAILYVVVPKNEGTKDEPYKDPVGLLTVCSGHVGADIVAGKTYSKAECQQILENDLVDHAEGVLACTPALAGQTYPLAAVVDFAFNVGVSKYCGSTMAKLFQSGDIARGCKEFPKWRLPLVNGKPLPGVITRRKMEQDVCMRGIHGEIHTLDIGHAADTEEDPYLPLIREGWPDTVPQ